MTDQELFTLVAKMRKYQKQFFASKPGTEERNEALKESKATEKQVDAEIAIRLSGQADLFG